MSRKAHKKEQGSYQHNQNVTAQWETDPTGRRRVVELTVRRAEGLDSKFLQGVKVAEIEARINQPKKLRRPRLTFNVPASSYKFPDAFYARVGRIYSGLISSGSRAPVKEIAAANEYDEARVRYWIREARRRGHLGPPRQGARG